ncbi:MAG TPA: polyketide synthase docking domain-containing protein [Puia sp.]
MTEEKDDMISGESAEPDEKKLLDYLRGSLSDAERAQFENRVPSDPFLQDAVDGLHSIENQEDLPKLVNHLNQQLRHHLSNTRTRKGKKDLRFEDWIYWSIGLILLLALAGFLVLRLLLKH